MDYLPHGSTQGLKIVNEMLMAEMNELKAMIQSKRKKYALKVSILQKKKN